MSTILDVSKLAGVSKATVSRVMNGTGHVKQSTREIVFAAMEELGFRPNKLAQALATNRTDSIGLVVSNFDGAYIGYLLQKASLTAKKANKQLIVTDSHRDPDFEYETVKQMEGRCDAIVLYSRILSNDHILKLNKELKTPLVLINRTFPETQFNTVTFNQADATSMMMSHLISYGHREIACITGPMDNPTSNARLAGYIDTLHKHAIPYNPHKVKHANYLVEGGYNACRELIEEKASFSAIFAFNDYMAIGAMKALAEAGIKVPEQVSIAGIDNCDLAGFVSPSLTTIQLPLENMTEKAVEIAIKLIDNPEYRESYEYKGKLIQRDSVKPANANMCWLKL